MRRDKHGQPIPCAHSGCGRDAVRIVSFERPNHPEFFGQCHDCCAVHSRPDRKPKPGLEGSLVQVNP